MRKAVTTEYFRAHIKLTQDPYMDGTNEDPIYVAHGEDEQGVTYKVSWIVPDLDLDHDDQQIDWDSPSSISIVGTP